MNCNIRYSRFIIQNLIGNRQWSSKGSIGSYYQVGTVPNNKLESYALDFRMMIHSTDEGYRPLSIYARRARKPMVPELKKDESSWNILGTNLSSVNENGIWESDVSRLMLMDRKGFNQLGIGLDELIDAYLQTVLTSIAIDKMARNLINTQGNFRLKLFSSLNNDPVLLDEIMKGSSKN